MNRIGTRAQVMHGNAKQTGGGLKMKDLKYNKHGKIVSKKVSSRAKKEKRLQKAGFKTQKGVFKLFTKQYGGDKEALDFLINILTITQGTVPIYNKPYYYVPFTETSMWGKEEAVEKRKMNITNNYVKFCSNINKIQYECIDMVTVNKNKYIFPLDAAYQGIGTLINEGVEYIRKSDEMYTTANYSDPEFMNILELETKITTTIKEEDTENGVIPDDYSMYYRIKFRIYVDKIMDLLGITNPRMISASQKTQANVEAMKKLIEKINNPAKAKAAAAEKAAAEKEREEREQAAKKKREAARKAENAKKQAEAAAVRRRMEEEKRAREKANNKSKLISPLLQKDMLQEISNGVKLMKSKVRSQIKMSTYNTGVRGRLKKRRAAIANESDTESDSDG